MRPSTRESGGRRPGRGFATFAPGEALFLPVGWWHHVRALDLSISLACNHFRWPNDHDGYKPGALR